MLNPWTGAIHTSTLGTAYLPTAVLERLHSSLESQNRESQKRTKTHKMPCRWPGWYLLCTLGSGSSDCVLSRGFGYIQLSIQPSTSHAEQGRLSLRPRRAPPPTDPAPARNPESTLLFTSFLLAPARICFVGDIGAVGRSGTPQWALGSFGWCWEGRRVAGCCPVARECPGGRTAAAFLTTPLAGTCISKHHSVAYKERNSEFLGLSFSI